MTDQVNIEAIVERLKNVGVFSLLKVVGVILIIATIFSSFYTVQPDEQAIVQRFGKFVETVDSGLHFKFPYVEKATILKTKQILQAEFGFRTKRVEGGTTEYASTNSGVQEEKSMLSGDLNVADVEWVVQYQISNPADYMFNTKDPVQNIHDVSESVMRRLVGDRMVSEVLTVGRTEIETLSKPLMQEALDQYKQGVTIVSVQLQEINPPEAVKDAFNEVNKAKQDQEKMINQAEQEYNRIIPKAEGLAEEQISQAQGYATKVQNQALGDVAKFDKIQAEYKLSPQITKKRIYLQTMEEIFAKQKIIFVDPAIKGSVMPFLNIKKETATQESK